MADNFRFSPLLLFSFSMVLLWNSDMCTARFSETFESFVFVSSTFSKSPVYLLTWLCFRYHGRSIGIIGSQSRHKVRIWKKFEKGLHTYLLLFNYILLLHIHRVLWIVDFVTARMWSSLIPYVSMLAFTEDEVPLLETKSILLTFDKLCRIQCIKH